MISEKKKRKKRRRKKPTWPRGRGRFVKKGKGGEARRSMSPPSFRRTSSAEASTTSSGKGIPELPRGKTFPRLPTAKSLSPRRLPRLPSPKRSSSRKKRSGAISPRFLPKNNFFSSKKRTPPASIQVPAKDGPTRMEIDSSAADDTTTSDAYDEVLKDARDQIKQQPNQEKVSKLLGIGETDTIVHQTIFRDGPWHGSTERAIGDAVKTPAKKKEPRTWRDERIVCVLDRSHRKSRKKGIRSSIDDGNHSCHDEASDERSTSDDDSENHPDRRFWYLRHRTIHCQGRLLKGLSGCCIVGNGNTFVFIKNCDLRGNDNIVVHCTGGQLRGDNYVVHYAESTVFYTTNYVLHTGKWNQDPFGTHIFPSDVRSVSWLSSSSSETETQ